MTAWSSFIDPMYGRAQLGQPLAALVSKPLVQRLRHVRLSNIDSIDIPSIANLSRFEHVLGVAHLAGHLGLRNKLDRYEILVLEAAALLHDWAITSFGHLVEEALQYVGTGFDHEKRLKDVVLKQAEILGADLQIFAGREAGLRAWARGAVGQDELKLLQDIMDHIDGKGRLGRVIAGDIDIDNIDNVFRMAFHMGLEFDRGVPLRLAKSIIDVEPEAREPVFRAGSEGDIFAWREMRRRVYDHLMLAEHDFVGKIMILSATVRAFQARELYEEDWKMVDHEFLVRLVESPTKEVRDTAQRWLAGELWVCTPIYWMKGSRPSYPDLLKFSETLSAQMDRYCFAYGIKDKRERVISAHFEDGRRETFGSHSNRWLFGVASSMKKAFSSKETRVVMDAACEAFHTSIVQAAHRAQENEQACLF
ncbi:MULTISPECIES: HD domain-containing protein [unclassified Bradyrhizobium]|uniref:HD domain-containing protein n=1 Tax=unclassified Bradyrhizobium TaxID=2631580 RepID=UPI002916494B|nr:MULTISPECIES: HD domain-containing protein [unclassified Bradyrhizobium]